MLKIAYLGLAESVPGGDAVWVMRSRPRESSARKTGKIGQNLCITICDRV